MQLLQSTVHTSICSETNDAYILYLRLSQDVLVLTNIIFWFSFLDQDFVFVIIKRHFVR